MTTTILFFQVLREKIGRPGELTVLGIVLGIEIVIILELAKRLV